MGVLKYECMCFIRGVGGSLWMGGALFAGGISGSRDFRWHGVG